MQPTLNRPTEMEKAIMKLVRFKDTDAQKWTKTSELIDLKMWKAKAVALEILSLWIQQGIHYMLFWYTWLNCVQQQKL